MQLLFHAPAAQKLWKALELEEEQSDAALTFLVFNPFPV